jgi:NAD(P)-dependent dehydrogenase (short-subunit alcohol dehydrogenase family)
VEKEGKKCLLFKGDISDEGFCKQVVALTHQELGQLNILVNNAGTHEDDEDVRNIETSQLVRTFAVNIFSFFYFTQAALEIMPEGGAIINTASVTAYRGSVHLIDYAATKGAIVSFTRSLAKNLAEKKIRVNGVAPGPVWTPLVVYSFDKEHLEKFGKDTPLGRAGYPHEIAPAYVYLASEDSSYMTGQILHINGGDVVNG